MSSTGRRLTWGAAWGIFPARNCWMQPRISVGKTGAMRLPFQHNTGRRIGGIEPATPSAGDTPTGSGKGTEQLS